jgi:hypothetical protein
VLRGQHDRRAPQLGVGGPPRLAPRLLVRRLDRLALLLAFGGQMVLTYLWPWRYCKNPLQRWAGTQPRGRHVSWAGSAAGFTLASLAEGREGHRWASRRPILHHSL